MNYKILAEIKYFYKMCKKKIRILVKRTIKAKKLILNKNKKRIYIILAADYGNFGDIAITYAQKQFLENILPEYDVVEIPGSKFFNYYYSLKRQVNKEDIITFIGGGNLGNLYSGFEDIRIQVINTFKDNLIISFPQTMVFTPDFDGEKALERTKKVYSKHKKLVLFAREEKSYHDMQKAFPKNEVYLVPDIVFSLKNKVDTNHYNGNKIGICFRNDIEKMLKIDVEGEIRKQLKENVLENISTYIGDDRLIYEKRYTQLFQLFDEIKNVKVYLTDRLHGMIFAYITETPCIVFDNSNHKIKATYEKWLKDCNYIKLLEEEQVKNIEQYIDDISKVKKNNINVSEKLKTIEEVIKKYTQKSL